MTPILLRVAREYSKHQQNLIRNFYKHRDRIDAQRLQEIVTDIYLAGQGRKAESLWKRAAAILERTPGLDRAEVARLIDGRDVEALARLANAQF